MEEDQRINVLITGLGGGGHGMEILKALRLSTLRYFFVGVDISKLSYGLDLVDRSYIVPPAEHSDYIATLLDIIRQNNIHVLFHGSEQELKVMSNNRDVFQSAGVFLPINTKPVIDLCMNKFSLMQFLKSEGVKVPRTNLVSSLNDAKQIDSYPLVCKPHLGSGGSNNVFIPQNRKEFRIISEYLLGYLDSFIAQEYIGDADSEYTVGVLSDGDGEVIDSIAVRRFILSALSSRIRIPNRTGRKDLGNVLVISSGISQGRIGRFKEVTEFCERIAKMLDSRGPLNFQCRLYKGDVYIFEINPRFSGTTNFRAMAGFNEPDILIRRYLLNQRLEEKRVPYNEGIILRSLIEKFFAA